MVEVFLKAAVDVLLTVVGGALLVAGFVRAYDVTDKLNAVHTTV